jgi:hydrogenase maturation protease
VKAAKRTIVVGLGNLLLKDDGVGVHAVRQLATDSPPGVTVVDAGTAVLHAADFSAGADRVLAIDAVQAGGTPGTVYRFDGYAAGQSAPITSVHSVGYVAALNLLPAAERPAELCIIGVEPESIAYGMELSDAGREALPRVIAETRRILKEWACGSQGARI